MAITTLLPQAAPTREQLDGPGPRSGVVHLVPSQKTLQQAVNDAKYGDVILVDHTATIVADILIPSQNSKDASITAGTPRRTNGDPSDILIVSDDPKFWNGTTCTTPATRVVTNREYPSGLTVFKSNARVTKDDYARMPRIQATAVGSHPIGGTSTFTAGGGSAYWRFVGLRIQQWAQAAESHVCVNFVNGTGGGHVNGELPGMHHHLTFDRCVFQGDPSDLALSVQQMLNWDGSYLTCINSSFYDCFASVGGESVTIYSTGEGKGPFYYENLEIEGVTAWFMGGSITKGVGVVPADITIRRVWVHRARRWATSDLIAYKDRYDGIGHGFNKTNDGWHVNIPASGATVSTTGGGTSGVFSGHAGTDAKLDVKRGYVIYDPVSGVAREVSSVTAGGNPTTDPLGNNSDTATLVTPWPTGGVAINNLRVFIQRPGGLIFNSGTVDGFTATTNGTTQVTFNQPLPVDPDFLGEYQPANTPIKGHYFRLNSSIWLGDGAVGTPPTSLVQRRIASIAADRRSLTLETAWPTSETKSFSVVAWDGRVRSAQNKALWEPKMGERILMEGCVSEFSSETFRQNTTNQIEAWGTIFTADVTVSNGGTKLTVTSGVSFTTANWWHTYFTTNWQTFGHPWPHLVICKSGNVFSQTAVIRSFDSATEATLEESDFTDGTHTVTCKVNSTPWYIGRDITWRHNIFRYIQNGVQSQQGTPNVWEVRTGQNFDYHDNLCVGAGHLMLEGGGATELGMMFTSGGRTPTRADGSKKAGHCFPGANANGKRRGSHNTWVKGVGNGVGGFHKIAGDAGSNPDPSTDIELNNDIVTGLQKDILYGNGNLAVDPTVIGWTQPYEVKRNVYIGSNAALAISDAKFKPYFPDNSALPQGTETAIFENYVGGDYRLKDVFAAGTVTLTSKRVIFSESFNKPSNTTPGPDLSWTVTRGSGQMLFGTWFGALGGGEAANVLCIARANAALPSANMYAKIDRSRFLTGSGTSMIGVCVRYDSAADSCYYARWELVGSTVTCRILKRVNGVDTSLTTAVDADALTATTYRLEATTVSGSVQLTALRDGVTIATVTDSTSVLTGLNGGAVIQDGTGSFSGHAVGDNYEHGELVATLPNTDLAKLQTGPWPASVVPGLFLKISGGAPVRITRVENDEAFLESNYPLAAGSGKTFAVTLKGSATDGRDPGADIAEVTDLVGGLQTLVDPDPVNSVDPGVASVLPGGTISATWHSVNATTIDDMIGLFQGGSGFLDWAYLTGGQTRPTVPAALDGTVNIPVAANRAPGAYTLGFYRGGTQLATAPLTVSAPPDTTSPVVTITAPAANATVSGSAVSVTATATDSVGVTSVKLFVDGIQNGATLTAAPYSFTLNTTGLTNGSHTLRVDAADSAGNVGTASRTVTVNNVTPDTTAPAVTITAPAANATVSGTTNVTATATDAVGVTSVRFFVDGVQTGPALTAAPFTYPLDTTTYGNGSHTIRVDAQDAAGNTGSASISVTVSNTVTSSQVASSDFLALMDRVTSLEGTYVTLNGSVNTVSGQVGTLSSQVTGLTAQVTPLVSLTTQVSGLSSQVSVLSVQVSPLTVLPGQVATLSSQVTGLSVLPAQVATLSSQVSTLSAQIAAMPVPSTGQAQSTAGLIGLPGLRYALVFQNLNPGAYKVRYSLVSSVNAVVADGESDMISVGPERLPFQVLTSATVV